MLTEFSEELWGALVDHVTVHSKDDIVFTLPSGMEIKAQTKLSKNVASPSGEALFL